MVGAPAYNGGYFGSFQLQEFLERRPTHFDSLYITSSRHTFKNMII